MKNRKQAVFKTVILREILFLILLIISGIIIRSLHFSYFLNFSHDQGLFSSYALDIYRNRTITLIGPSISYIYQGREIFQGGVIYYVFLFFLWIGSFDPIKSSYLFMVSAMFMLLPLFYGVKYLINRKAAYYVCVVFSLLPFYIDYTRFLWNPNFQFVFIPILFLLMGFYKKTKKTYLLFFVGIYAGFLLQFHYQFVIIIFGLIIYYFVYKCSPVKLLPLFISGILLGFSPLIIFELRNNFYNTQTIWYFISHGQYFLNSGGSMQPHYFLSLSLFMLIIVLSFLQRYTSYKKLVFLSAFLFILSAFSYGKKPSTAFGMSKNWNYLLEKKAHEIIKAQEIKNFNIANAVYDTKAAVQKYLLRREGILINEEDYYQNNYLFVITTYTDKFEGERAYEIVAFKPSVIVDKWNLSSDYSLYLLKKSGISD